MPGIWKCVLKDTGAGIKKENIKIKVSIICQKDKKNLHKTFG